MSHASDVTPPPGERPPVGTHAEPAGEHARPVLVCGRLGRHDPHTWLTRDDLWCPGTGEPGRTAPPDPQAEEKRKNKQKRRDDR